MSSKTIYSGGNRYDVKDIGGEKVVTTPTWFPGMDRTIGTAKSDVGALNVIKSDSGSKVTRQK
jgi:hypothetical protein